MQYPNITQYKEAILEPDTFATLNEDNCPVKNGKDLVMASGNFACVFKMQHKGRFRALKCFTKDIPERTERQKAIVKYIENNPSPYFVDYKYLENEIWIDLNGGMELPVTWMEWIEAPTLGQVIKEYCEADNTEGLKLLTEKFREFALWLLEQPFAHGDLKHDNLLVKEDGSLVMVDYDGMFIPDFAGKKALELGSKCYQHPKRNENHFNRDIDDFSILIIYTSLLALCEKPELYAKFNNGQNIIFDHKDFLSIHDSQLLNELKNIGTLGDSQKKIKNAIALCQVYIPDIAMVINDKNTEDALLDDKCSFVYNGDSAQIKIYEDYVEESAYTWSRINDLKIGTSIEVSHCEKEEAAIELYHEKKQFGLFYMKDNCEVISLINKGIKVGGVITEVNVSSIKVGLFLKLHKIKPFTIEWWNSLSDGWKFKLYHSTGFSSRISNDSIKRWNAGRSKWSSFNISYRYLTNEDIEKLLIEIRNIKSLKVSNIYENVTPLLELTKLKELKVNGHVNLSFLSELKYLEKLYIEGGNINDVTIFSDLINLKELTLEDISIKDFFSLSSCVSLSGLKHLEKLYIRGFCSAIDLTTISRLANLRELKFYHTCLKDFSFISKLKQLEKLHIIEENQHLFDSERYTLDLAYVSQLTNLKEIYLHDENNAVLIPSLAKLKHLKVFRLCVDTQDYSFLLALENLKELGLYISKKKNLQILSKLKHLEVLNIKLDSFMDLNFISELTTLKSLALKVRDEEVLIPSLKKLTGLEILKLDVDAEYYVTDLDLTFISKLITLKKLELMVNDKEVSFPSLEKLSRLEILKLDVVARDFTPLLDLVSLKELEFSNLLGGSVPGIDLSLPLVKLVERIRSNGGTVNFEDYSIDE